MMKNYIARELKKVKARPMSRGEYNNLRGWTIPEDENPDDTGFLVKNSATHMNWQPTDEFISTYVDI